MSKKNSKNIDGTLSSEHAHEGDKKLTPAFPPKEDEIEEVSAASVEDLDPEGAEQIQEDEKHAGFQGDDEEWEDELTGERPDNAYLPGQRLAEHGIERESFEK